MDGIGSRRRIAAWIMLAGALVPAALAADRSVVITEIQYHPAAGDGGGEWLEIFNAGADPADLTGWRLEDDIAFTFPPATVLAPGAYLVIFGDPAMPAVHGIANAVGPFSGSLGNGGGRIVLLGDDGSIRDEVAFLDGPPWPAEADGAGPSLELLDPLADNADPASWGFGRPSSPGRPNDPAPAGGGEVAITEILYKPLKRRLSRSLDPFWIDKGNYWEKGDDPRGEYVEILNRSAAPVDLGGWKLADDGGVLLALPAGTVLAVGARLALCADAAAIAAQYGTARVTGDFAAAGDLSDAGERLSLLDGSGRLVDTVKYGDSSPWPVGPDDAGTSLECLDPLADNGVPENWRACRVPAKAPPASPRLGDEHFLDRGTPGAPNSAASAGLPPFLPLDGLDHLPARPTSRDAVTVIAGPVSGEEPIRLSLEYRTYVPPYQAVASTGTVDLRDDGTSGDAAAGDGIRSAALPALASGTLVRYRVRATDGAGRSWTYPDDGEPSPNKAFFVDDGDDATGLAAWHLILPQASAAALDRDIWTREYVEAALVADGIVHDHIGTHYRGRGWRVHPKKGWTFGLNKPDLFRGMSSVDLAMHFPVLQKLVHEIFWKTGHGNLAAEPIRLYRNGAFAGLYLAQESPNTSWLRERGLGEDGEVFKASAAPNFFAGGWSGTNIADLRAFDDPGMYPQLYERKGNGLGSFESLLDLTWLVSKTPAQDIVEALGGALDLDDWLYRWAVHVAGAHGDIIGTNYFVVRPGDPASPWQILYYDFDLFFGCQGLDFTDVACWPPTMDPWLYFNRFHRRVMDDPELKARFLVILDDVLRTAMTEEKVNGLVDAWMAATEPDRAEEVALGIGGPGPYVLSPPDPAEIKGYFAQRRSWLLGTWLPSQGFRPAANAHPTIVLGRPALVADGLRIGWTHADAEGDPAAVDLYWRDRKWSPLTPVPGGQGIPAEAGGFEWIHAGGDPAAGLIVHAVIRDGVSDLEGHGESEPVDPPAAPVLVPAGGAIEPPAAVRIESPGGLGTVYYTIDGNDPMRRDGEPDPAALVYREPLVIAGAAVVRARTRVDLSGGFWSDLTVGRFTVSSGPPALAITEIMYAPPEGSRLAFVELHNPGTRAASLAGYSFVRGIEYTFPAGAALDPGTYLVVVADAAAFASRYGDGIAVAGVFSGLLSVSGERIALSDASGTAAIDLSFQSSWYPETRGGGRSLVLVDPRSSPGTWSSKAAWAPSAADGGSPGRADGEDPGSTRFLRGDGNADGKVDLSDAVASLAYQFMGTAAPACLRALDGNGSGGLDITDPIYILSFLFAGGPAPPEPYPACGADAAAGGLTCESHEPCR